MIIPVFHAEVTHRIEVADGPYPANVVYGVDNSTGLTAEAIAATAAEAFGDTLMQYLVNVASLTNTRAKRGPNSTGSSADDGYVQAGLEGSNSAPPNVAVVIQKRTATGGRTGRGRMYLPFIDETKIDRGGVLDSTYQSNVQAAADAFISALAAADIPMVLLHQLGGSSDDTPHLVTSLNVAQRVGTQRRRLRR